MILAPLERLDLVSQQLTTAQAASNQHGERGMIATLPYRPSIVLSEHSAALICTQPIAYANTKAADAFHSANAGGRFGAEKASIRRLVRYAPNGSEPQGDRCGRVVMLLEVNA